MKYILFLFFLTGCSPTFFYKKNFIDFEYLNKNISIEKHIFIEKKYFNEFKYIFSESGWTINNIDKSNYILEVEIERRIGYNGDIKYYYDINIKNIKHIYILNINGYVNNYDMILTILKNKLKYFNKK